MAKTAKTKRTPAADGDVQPFFRYADFLAHEIVYAPKRTKGERTKEALKLGAIRVLDDVGYHAMRVADVCQVAQVASATFYLYFESKADITLNVLSDYLERGVALLPMRHGSASAFESILAANLRWLQVCRANAGLLRCILQLGDEESGFRELVQRSNRAWYERIALSVSRRFPKGAVSEDAALLVAYSLGAMMDEMARKLIVYPDPELQSLTARIVPTDEEVAQFFAVLWHRALYGGLPIEADLAPTAQAIANLNLTRD